MRIVSGALVLLSLARRLAATRAARRRAPGARRSFCSDTRSRSRSPYVAVCRRGALLFFGAVQATMFVAGFRAGERFGPVDWCGVAIAVTGVACCPARRERADLARPVMMAAAGSAGRLHAARPPAASGALTAVNFLRACRWRWPRACAGRHVGTSPGRSLAVASGAVTSGIGYVLWYTALQGLTATRAAVIQLSVPAIAALGGVVFLLEPVSWRLVSSSIAILGGIGMTLTRRVRAPL